MEINGNFGALTVVLTNNSEYFFDELSIVFFNWIVYHINVKVWLFYCLRKAMIDKMIKYC